MQIEQFLEDLASDSPTPGGGSASALAGALSASLVIMVAGLSRGKEPSLDKEMARIKKEALTIQKRLYWAVEEDAKSYDAVIEAFRLPREKEKERLYRSRRIQQAYCMATVPPQKVCELSLRLLELSKILLAKGNPNAFSDTGVAIHLASASLEGGILNIRINLTSIRDVPFKKKMEGLMARILAKKNRLMVTALGALERH